MKRKIFSTVLIVLCIPASLAAFDSGAVLGLKALFSGSYTDIHINESDLKKMRADYLKGSVGFIMNGEAELTYIFDAKRYFNMDDASRFGGLGLGFFLGIGQGFAGEISGAEGVDVFVNVSYTPVVHLGTEVKAYFFKNRLVAGFGLGARIIVDATPSYDMYNNGDPNEKALKAMDGVGTIIVTKDMMKKMNPVGFLLRGSLEYIQPIISTTELAIGGYMSYCIYRPKYIAMPAAVEEGAKAKGFDAKTTPLKSFYLNSLDFGVTMGLNFKVNP